MYLKSKAKHQQVRIIKSTEIEIIRTKLEREREREQKYSKQLRIRPADGPMKNKQLAWFARASDDQCQY